MIPVDNFITEMIHENNMSKIILKMVLDNILDEKDCSLFISKFMLTNPILKYYIFNIDGKYLWIKDENNIFNPCNFYKIKNCNFKEFDFKKSSLINKNFTSKYKWFFNIYNDISNNKSCMILNISHEYCDGYKLIKMITETFEYEYKIPKFKRMKNTLFENLYYFIIGTFILIIINMSNICKTFLNHYFCNKSQKINNISKKVIYSDIVIPSLELKEIKDFSKKNNIMINDFLYSLMVKTLNKYNFDMNNNIDDIRITCPINIKNDYSNNFYTNNVYYLFSIINSNNYCCNKDLLRDAHNTFNLYKYSLFILILIFLITNIIKYIPIKIKNFLIDTQLNEIDLLYSNIIGPDLNTCFLGNKKIKCSNVSFSTIIKNSSISSNIISYNGKININITFKKNLIKDKNKFIECLMYCYNDLLTKK